LLNSIEVNIGKDMPVAVIAYDNNIAAVEADVSHRENVFIISDPACFKSWEDFSYDAWKGHPTALSTWAEKGIQGVNRIGMNRRYYAFDAQAPFDKFLYFDADILVLNSLKFLFEQLQSSDFIVYDFQFKDSSHIYNLESSKLYKLFPQNRIDKEIFCAGFYGGRKGLFTPKERSWLAQQLMAGEAEILYPNAPNQSLLNYMKMRLNIPVFNFALELPPEKRTGCSVTSPHFERRAESLLYDKNERLTYLHYIGVSSSTFRQLCQGENLDFPYRELFLHYRYLKDPKSCPTFSGSPISPQTSSQSWRRKIMSKLGIA
ncbi:MAG: Npun_R2821/Npun_R2822 family protein, partial [Verrucomicrobiota bacterium]